MSDECREQILALRHVATTPEEQAARIEAAHAMLADLCEGRVRWHMSIPVRPDDPDIVLADGLSAADAALKRAEAAEAKWASVPWESARIVYELALTHVTDYRNTAVRKAIVAVNTWLYANAAKWQGVNRPQEEPHD